jgi:hypothetical protein
MSFAVTCCQSRFCAETEVEVVATNAYVEIHDEAEVPSRKVECPRCRAILREAACKYCTMCGMKLDVSNEVVMSGRPDNIVRVVGTSENLGTDPDRQAIVPWHKPTKSYSQIILEESEPPPLPEQENSLVMKISKPSDIRLAWDQHQLHSDMMLALEDDQGVEDCADLGMLKVTFWYKGEDREISFSRKPLGLRWRLKLPIKVDQVLQDSHAEEVGVKKGWQMKVIDGIDVSGFSYTGAAQVLQRGLEKLSWTKVARKEQSRRISTTSIGSTG